MKDKIETTLWMIIIGMVIFSAGTVSNFVVIKSNECKMPVHHTPYSFEISTHFSYEEPNEVNYHYLSDFMKLNYWKEQTIYFSIGDVLFLLGSGMSFIFLINYWRLTFKRRKEGWI
jgi:hypothetical protein